MKESQAELKQQHSQANDELIKEIALKLLAYCRANNWAGHDPYDALNSRLFRALPFLDFKMARLILTQIVKRFPLNLRPLLLVQKTLNPKGIALLLSSNVKLSEIGVLKDNQEMRVLADTLLALRSPGGRYSCWGYNFDWQTRNELVPARSPNIVCSTFAANALLDASEQAPDSSWLEAVVSAAEFILDVLYWREGKSVSCISYTPLWRSEIHNANLLGAAFLCRTGRTSGQAKFLQPALNAARYSVSKQRADGSWPYGEGLHQEWIDNFHTGFNLVALKRIGEYAQTAEFDSAISRGFHFYRTHFFREDGAPKYYHDSRYPLDIHGVAQAIITLVEFKHFEEDNIALAHLVLKWSLENMWNGRGYFYFQKHPHYTVRTPFIRWSQAWMLLALSTFLEKGLNAA